MTLPSADEARARMLAAIAALDPEPVTLADAVGRVLARTVRAARDQPPFDASSMDGWAVRRADASEASRELLIVGESAAGRPWDGRLTSGQTVRISTGAPLPEGADAVVIQEDAERLGDHVRVGRLSQTPSYIRPAGCDFPAGAELLEAGVRLTPWTLALAAASGAAVLEVVRRPRVAVLTTGDELAAAGAEAAAHQIFDSAGPAVVAACAGWGATVVALRKAADSRRSVLEAMHDFDVDLVVTIGGASVGDHDVVKPALGALGLELVLEGVAVRPGKPTWFGRLADGRHVLGLPGNPVSALVCAELFLRPILARLQNEEAPLRFVTAQAAGPVPRNGPREHFLRGRLHVGEGGRLLADVASDQDSSLVSVLARSNALIRRRPNAPSAAPGETVEAALLGRLEPDAPHVG